ncbi:MAG: hypothetical protein LBN93_07210, partial [Candidatus Symbiothrix sp.]|nr:hypothetical protein [Candidatus Symbiothrix sp.]
KLMKKLLNDPPERPSDISWGLLLLLGALCAGIMGIGYYSMHSPDHVDATTANKESNQGQK